MLTTAEDATLALKVPPDRPEKALRDKGYSMRDVERIYAAISGWESARYGWMGTGRVTEVQCVRDVLLLHAKCGMHGTEIDRLARGEGKVKLLQGQGAIAGTITFIHKSGRVHVQSVDAQALAAAMRLQARGSAPADWWIRQVVKRAAKFVGLEPLRTGELRRSFVTWAVEYGTEVGSVDGGVPLTRIAATIGHQSAVTTKKFYEGVKVPPRLEPSHPWPGTSPELPSSGAPAWTLFLLFAAAPPWMPGAPGASGRSSRPRVGHDSEVHRPTSFKVIATGRGCEVVRRQQVRRVLLASEHTAELMQPGLHQQQDGADDDGCAVRPLWVGHCAHGDAVRDPVGALAGVTNFPKLSGGADVFHLDSSSNGLDEDALANQPGHQRG